MPSAPEFVRVPPRYHAYLRKLKLSPDAMLVAYGLRTFPGHTMTGIHLLQVELEIYVFSEFGYKLTRAKEIVAELVIKGFCRYKNGVLWVVDQSRGLRLAPRDKKVIGVQRHLKGLCEQSGGHNPVVTAFVEMYGEALHVTDPGVEFEPPAESEEPTAPTAEQPQQVGLSVQEPDRKVDGLSEPQWQRLARELAAARTRAHAGQGGKPHRAKVVKLTAGQRRKIKKLLEETDASPEELFRGVARMGESLFRWSDPRAPGLCGIDHFCRHFTERFRHNPGLDKALARPPERGRRGFDVREVDLGAEDFQGMESAI